MTQHKWQTTDGYDCMAGWDRPLNSFFFQVGQPCTCQDHELETDELCSQCDGMGEIWAYENLNDKRLFMGRMRLADVQDRMTETLTAWPSAIIRALQADQVADRGNEVTRYDTVGEVKNAPS